VGGEILLTLKGGLGKERAGVLELVEGSWFLIVVPESVAKVDMEVAKLGIKIGSLLKVGN